MPASIITRLPSKSTSVVLLGGDTFTAPNRQDEYLRKISWNARRLRQGYGVNGALNLNLVGRKDSLSAALVRGGIIPIMAWQQVSMHATFQAAPAHRNQPTGETVTIDAGPTTFAENGAAVDVTFGTAGVTNIAATSSLDANAVGKAQIVVS